MHRFKFLNYIFVTLLIASAFAEVNNAGDFLVGRKQISYRSADLTQDRFLSISRLSDTKHLREAVKNILVPRIVGTEGHTRVRNYIVESMQKLQWNVEVHKFHENVPVFGKLHFHNIIATLNPNAERFLVLACHYDSKYMPDFEFLGATDSAVPCAMLINLAKVLQDELEPFRSSNKLSLMLLFFDGEEAFEEWTAKDSIYGARNLAKKWDAEGVIDRIDMLVLLDLIGAPDPTFYSFFPNTESWHSRLVDIEDRLSNAGLMERYANSGVSRHNPNRYFQPNSLRSSYIEDDHLPFLKRNIPILHLIPLPFPSVWHTANDNESIIDYVTTENIGRLIRVFTMEYLLSSVST